MKLYFSGTPEEFKEIARRDDADDYGDGTQLPTFDGGIILCGTVCEADAKSFKICLGDSAADVVQIFNEILILDSPQWLFSVGDFVQVKVRFKPVQTAEDTFLYRLIADKVIGRTFRRN